MSKNNKIKIKSIVTINGIQSFKNTLSGIFGIDWMYKLKYHSDECIEKLKQTYSNTSTLRTYLSKIMTIIKEDGETDYKITQSYYELWKEFDKKEQIKLKNHIASDRIKDNWISWEEILDVRKKLESKAITHTSYQKYLIICMYTYIPPRRLDYGNLQVLKKKPFPDAGNYLIWNKAPYIVLNNHKTSAKVGQIKFILPIALVRIIKKWFKLYNTNQKWLLIKNNNEVLKNNTLGSYITSIFKNEINKKISVNQLRHIYAKKSFESLQKGNLIIGLKKVTKDCVIMGHNMSKHSEYVKEI